MKHLATPLVLCVCFLFASAGAASAANVHNAAIGGTGMKGPPSQTCLSSSTTMSEPGNASSSPGAPFNETKPGNADLHYAGTQPQNTKTNGPTMTHVVGAQYDVACFQQSQHK